MEGFAAGPTPRTSALIMRLPVGFRPRVRVVLPEDSVFRAEAPSAQERVKMQSTGSRRNRYTVSSFNIQYLSVFFSEKRRVEFACQFGAATACPRVDDRGLDR